MKKICFSILTILFFSPLSSWCSTYAATSAPAEEQVLLFSFFKEPNGRDGLHLATSEDGINWTELNNGKSFLVPCVGKDSLMRDPSICQGPDGLFHMVWTSSWQSRSIGYASSKDLIHWSEQRDLPVMENDLSTKNCWAPEIFYDDTSKEYYIVWASSVDSNPIAPNKDGNNHRLFEVHTKDFQTFSPAKLMYCPPSMTVIDACFLKKDGTYYMFAKNEDKGAASPMKYVYMTSADSFLGNYPYENNYGDRKISREWVEGPSVFEWKGEVFVIYDMYRTKQYGAIRSKDMKIWSPEQPLTIPRGLRHGTVFKAPASILKNILETK